MDDVGDCTGIRGLSNDLAGLTGVDGNTDGFDLLYFEDADGEYPFPE